MTFVDSDMDKVYAIQSDINLLKIKYNFINKILYISDSEIVGIKIYNPMIVYIFHHSILKDFINGFSWEGDYNIFKNDLKIIDSLYNKYINIELILPIAPNYAMIKYANKEYARYKELSNYIHEDYCFVNKSAIERIKYYIINLLKKWFYCYDSDNYTFVNL